MKCFLNDSPTSYMPCSFAPSHTALHSLLYKSSAGKSIYVNFSQFLKCEHGFNGFILTLIYSMCSLFFIREGWTIITPILFLLSGFMLLYMCANCPKLCCNWLVVLLPTVPSSRTLPCITSALVLWCSGGGVVWEWSIIVENGSILTLITPRCYSTVNTIFT